MFCNGNYVSLIVIVLNGKYYDIIIGKFVEFIDEIKKNE